MAQLLLPPALPPQGDRTIQAREGQCLSVSSLAQGWNTVFYKDRTVWAARHCYGPHPTRQEVPALPTPMPAGLEDPRALLSSKSIARAQISPVRSCLYKAGWQQAHPKTCPVQVSSRKILGASFLEQCHSVVPTRPQNQCRQPKSPTVVPRGGKASPVENVALQRAWQQGVMGVGAQAYFLDREERKGQTKAQNWEMYKGG